MSRTSTETVEALTTGFTLPRVNLLPPEVHEARKLRRLQVGLVSGVAAVAVLLGALYLTQVQAADSAKNDLAGATSTGQTLTAQKATYAAVPNVISAIDDAGTARAAAMSQDVQWYRYLNDLTYITPKNAWLTQLSVAFTNGASSSAALSPGGIATVTVQGDAKNHVDVASWLDAVAKEHGWNNAYFSNSARDTFHNTPIVKFSSTINVTAAALSHRYDRKAG
jgi:Tfp pilus assembly protein PilN